MVWYFPGPLDELELPEGQAISRSGVQWSPCGQFIVVSQEVLAQSDNEYSVSVYGLIWDVATRLVACNWFAANMIQEESRFVWSQTGQACVVLATDESLLMGVTDKGLVIKQRRTIDISEDVRLSPCGKVLLFFGQLPSSATTNEGLEPCHKPCVSTHRSSDFGRAALTCHGLWQSCLAQLAMTSLQKQSLICQPWHGTIVQQHMAFVP